MIADVALDVGTDVEKIKAAKVGTITIADAIADTIAKIGENMTLRRAAALSVGTGRRSRATCTTRSPKASARSASWSRSNSTGKADELKRFGRMVAMHVAAANPQALDPSGLDPEVIRREKDVLAESSRRRASPRMSSTRSSNQGSRPSTRKSACSIRPSSTSRTRASRRRSRKPKARSARRSRSPASCATRSAKASSGRRAILPPKSQRPVKPT